MKRPSIFLMLALLAGCSNEPREPGSPESRGVGGAPTSSHAAPGRAGAHDWFADRAEESGLTFAYFNGMSGEFCET
jgi:hypothetical protein